MKVNNSYNVIIFVEGATEVVFYQNLIDFLSKTRKTKVSNYLIINAKGIGRFESKMPAKFKNEIVPKYPDSKIVVCCCYDTDVFKFKSQPPINWQKVISKLKEYGASDVKLVKAKRMIEDWFLIDLDGLCTFLKIKKPSRIKGRSGNEKMISLFKRSGKIYQKGTYCYKFIEYLDIQKIYKIVETELKQLDILLFPNEKRKSKIKNVL